MKPAHRRLRRWRVGTIRSRVGRAATKDPGGGKVCKSSSSYWSTGIAQLFPAGHAGGFSSHFVPRAESLPEIFTGLLENVMGVLVLPVVGQR